MSGPEIEVLAKPRVSIAQCITLSSDSESDVVIEKTLSQTLVEECVENIFDSVIQETHIPEVSSDIYFAYENFRESFQCLTRIELSRSSVLNDPFNRYPFIENPCLEKTLWSNEPEPEYDKACKQLYLDLCKKYEAMPIDRVYKTLHTRELNLKYYGLNMKSVRPITETIIKNGYIKVLNLESNYLTPDAVAYISAMLCENSNINTLILKRCKLGPNGAKELDLGIRNTRSLVFLDLSYNEIGDDGIRNMETGLKENNTIKELILKYNNLAYDAVDILTSTIIDYTKTLQKLDLSWNHFYVPNACVMLLDNLRYNRTITHLNLSWNSLPLKPILKSLGRCLTDEGCTWTHLDLSHNKFSGEEEIISLRRILRKNDSLIEVNLSGNPIHPRDTAVLLTVFEPETVRKTQLKTMILKHIYLNKADEMVLEPIPRDKEVILGGILQNYEIKGPDYGKMCIERIKFLNDAHRKKKKKKGPPEFGTWLFTLPEKPMRKDDFRTAIEQAKMSKLDPELVTEFLKNFQTPKKRVDVLYLREFYMKLYPDTQMPPKPPEPKAENEQTNVESVAVSKAVTKAVDKSSVEKLEENIQHEQATSEGQGEQAPLEKQGEQAPLEEQGEQAPLKEQGEQAQLEEQGEQAPLKEQGEQAPLEEQSKQAPLDEQGEQAPLEEQGKQELTETPNSNENKPEEVTENQET